MEETIHINRRVIEKCLEGDIKAQYQLYKQYARAMYNIAIRILNNKMDAEEESGEDVPDVDPALVHAAIKELPHKGRAVLVLKALEGYTHKEIAEMLEISVSTSKTQYSRALSLLNRKLKGKMDVN